MFEFLLWCYSLGIDYKNMVIREIKGYMLVFFLVGVLCNRIICIVGLRSLSVGIVLSFIL